jgi:hypothetical protein
MRFVHHGLALALSIASGLLASRADAQTLEFYSATPGLMIFRSLPTNENGWLDEQYSGPGEPLCPLPCRVNARAYAGERLFIAPLDEEKIPRSWSFDVGWMRNDARVSIKAGSTLRRRASLALLVFGGIGIGASFPMGIVGHFDAGPNDGNGLMIGAVTAGLAGLGLLVGGAVLRATSNTTLEMAPPPRAALAPWLDGSTLRF